MLEKIHKMQCNKQTKQNSGTREHTRKQIDGIVQTKSEPKCGTHENALVAQYQRDASTIAQQADTELVHNLLGKNATTSIPSMLYVWYSDDMIQDDVV